MTEVYFEGFGWVPFDPTPLQEGNTTAPDEKQGDAQVSPSPSPTPTPTPTPTSTSDEQNTATPTPEPGDTPQPPTPTPSQPPQDQSDNNPDTSPEDDTPNPFPWLWLLAAAAVAALGTRIALRMPAHVAKRQPAARARVFVYGAAVRRLLGYAKRQPKKGETPLACPPRGRGAGLPHAHPAAVEHPCAEQLQPGHARPRAGEQRPRGVPQRVPRLLRVPARALPAGRGL